VVKCIVRDKSEEKKCVTDVGAILGGGISSTQTEHNKGVKWGQKMGF